jgi:hypothetical protein
MGRLFSAFPSGAPGVGLLLLRASVVIGLITLTPSAGILVVAATALASAFVIGGLATPCVSAAISIWSLLAIVTAATTWLSGVLTCVCATALALLGPGAYSIDARLFGWNRVRLPSSDRDPA